MSATSHHFKSHCDEHLYRNLHAWSELFPRVESRTWISSVKGSEDKGAFALEGEGGSWWPEAGGSLEGRQIAGQCPSSSLACGERSAADGRGNLQGGGPGDACVGVEGPADTESSRGSSAPAALSHATAFATLLRCGGFPPWASGCSPGTQVTAKSQSLDFLQHET